MTETSAGLDARLRAELGMPFLPTVFTLLADHPSYLRAATEAFLACLPDALNEHARVVRSIGFGAAASLVPDPWQVGSSASSIAALLDSYNEVNPPSLLFVLSLSPAPTRGLRVMEPPLPEPPAATDRNALLTDIDVCHGNFRIPGFWHELVAVAAAGGSRVDAGASVPTERRFRPRSRGGPIARAR